MDSIETDRGLTINKKNNPTIKTAIEIAKVPVVVKNQPQLMLSCYYITISCKNQATICCYVNYFALLCISANSDLSYLF